MKKTGRALLALICAAAMLLSMGALSFAKDEVQRVQPIQIIALLEMTDQKTTYVIHNPNAFAVEVYWGKNSNSQNDGMIMAEPGDSVIETPGENPNFSIKWYAAEPHSAANSRTTFTGFVNFKNIYMYSQEGGRLTAELNGNTYDDILCVAKGWQLTFFPIADEGYETTGVFDKQGNKMEQTVTVTSNITVTAKFEVKQTSEGTGDDPVPEGGRVYLDNYGRFLYGYDTGDVGPDDAITRMETATMIYRLLYQGGETGRYQKPAQPSFPNLSIGHWGANGMEYMAYIGMYPDPEEVNPFEVITRGEAAKMLAFAFRISADGEEDLAFADLQPGDPYYTYVKALVYEGVLNGYEDNTMRLSESFTRAQMVKTIDIIIERFNEGYARPMYDISEMECPYEDLAELGEGYWAYEYIMLASTSFKETDGGTYVAAPELDLPKTDME